MITDMLARLWTFDTDEVTVPTRIGPISVYIESDDLQCYYAIDHAGHTEFARTLNDAAAIVRRIADEYHVTA